MSIINILINSLKDSLKNIYFYLLIAISFVIMFINRAIILFNTIDLGEYNKLVFYINTLTYYILYTLLIILYLYSIIRKDINYHITRINLFGYLFLNICKMFVIAIIPMIIGLGVYSQISQFDLFVLSESNISYEIKVIYSFFVGIIYYIGSAIVLVDQTSKSSVVKSFKLIKTNIFIVVLIISLIFYTIYLFAHYILSNNTTNIALTILNYSTNIFYKIYIPFNMLFISRVLYKQNIAKTSPNKA